MSVKREHTYLTQISADNLEKLSSVYHKSSESRGIGLNIFKKDFSHNPLKDAKILSSKSVASDQQDLSKAPHLSGIVEGVVRVNPWSLPKDSYIFVEVFCRFVYYNSKLPPKDYEEDYFLFKRTELLLPEKCESYEKDCVKSLNVDTKSYSPIFQKYFNSLGGYVGTRYEKDEYIDRNGANEPLKQTRMNKTCIPRSESVAVSNKPDQPYILLNLPFKFDISDGPDSVLFKNDYHISRKNRPARFEIHDFYKDKTLARMSYENECLGQVISDEKWDLEDLIKITGMTRTQIRERFKHMKIRQMQKDHLHRSSYPYLKNLKKLPPNGIHWYVKAYAAPDHDLPPYPKHICCLNIRKLSYYPILNELRLLTPPNYHDDYHLSIQPDNGTSAGLISMFACLNQSFFSRGDTIEVFIKLHNESVRCIQNIEIELVQNVSFKFNPGRVNRSIICRRILDNEHSSTFPIQPAQTNILVLGKLHPWPTTEQCLEIREKMSTMEPSQVKYELEAWNVHPIQRFDNDLAIIYPASERTIPPCNINDLHVADSTLDLDLINLLVSCRQPDYEKEENAGREQCLWNQSPYPNCCCISAKEKGAIQRACCFPPSQPYQSHMNSQLCFEENIDLNHDRMLDYIRNRKDSIRRVPGKFVHRIEYEVQIRASLRHQDTTDIYHHNEIVKTIFPKSEDQNKDKLYAFFGPQLSIPVIYLNNEKNYEQCFVPMKNERVKRYHDIPSGKETVSAFWRC